jgi:hypothetical protein
MAAPRGCATGALSNIEAAGLPSSRPKVEKLANGAVISRDKWTRFAQGLLLGGTALMQK